MQRVGAARARRTATLAAADGLAAESQFDDLRAFIAQVEAAGELRRFQGASAHLEIGAITEVLAEEGGPAALFDSIPGYRTGVRVFSNAFGTLSRTARLLRVDPGLSGVSMLSAWREKLRAYSPVPPREVSWGPVLENQHTGGQVDLEIFPAPLWHEQDGGRYLGTGCCVITRDPDSGVVNVGTYRGMLQNRNQITLLINKGKQGRINMEKYHARGQACPIVVSLGQDPTVFLASMTPLPGTQSELDYAGWVRGRPVDVIKGPISSLPVPATAEVVLEGEIPLPEEWPALAEGPFGEWPGYYTESSERGCPVMNVRAVYYRNEPIVHGAPPMAPPAVYLLAVPISSATLWEQLERAGLPGITGVWGFISSGQSGFFTVVSVKQAYAGHAKQVGLVATGARAGAYGGRFVVVVDDDIDVSNPREVIWAIATRCDVREHIDFVRDVWTTPVDPVLSPEQRERRNFVSDRAIILAVRPYLWRDQFPAVCSFPRAVKAATKEKWEL